MPDPLIALGMTALIAALGAWLFWPKRGMLSRWRHASRLNERVLTEDALKHLHNCQMQGRHPSLEGVAGALQIPIGDAVVLLNRMQEQGLLTARDGELRLTAKGRHAALHIIRAHRLWERYLADETGFDEAEWHERAERFEHTLLPADADALAARLGNPTHDPHGDPIPTAAGEYVGHGGHPLARLGLDQPGRIVHIEDEPETIYAQLVAEGLYPGMQVRIVESTPQRVRFWASGDEHVLAPLLATNISVVPIPEVSPAQASPEEPGETLAVLKPGEQGEVIAILPRCRGPERRRMMDLGILPGTVITAEMTSPGGDPTAYRIRDALIALRQEQARSIKVARLARDG